MKSVSSNKFFQTIHHEADILVSGGVEGDNVAVPGCDTM
jgi:hypothetical protein